MTREIKFRTWVRNPLHAMIVPDAVGWKGGSISYDSRFYDDYDLMQYTGLHDKNGKEIYEGDIVRSHNDTRLIGTVVFGNYPIGHDDWGVDFVTPCFCQEWSDKSGYTCLDDSDSIEVIGNIYENPGLLEDK